MTARSSMKKLMEEIHEETEQLFTEYLKLRKELAYEGEYDMAERLQPVGFDLAKLCGRVKALSSEVDSWLDMVERRW